MGELDSRVLDGRVARRRRNREAVIEAAVALMQEGVLDPSVEQITERSGVSPRSVFRYFENLDEMRHAVIVATAERIGPLMAPLEQPASLEERTQRIVDTRLAMFEQVEGAARAARLREPQAPMIADDLSSLRNRQRAQIRAYFQPELEHRDDDDTEQLAAVVEVLLSFESWDLLRRVQGRDTQFVRGLWARALLDLLRSHPASNGSGQRVPQPAGVP